MPPKKPLDVATAYKELEELAQWFEKGEPDIDAGLEKFKRAHELAAALQVRLQEAEQVIREIRTSSADVAT
jgi:exodeoxyribonuclease VII small subunit